MWPPGPLKRAVGGQLCSCSPDPHAVGWDRPAFDLKEAD